MQITMDLRILQPMGRYIFPVANLNEKYIPIQGRRRAGWVYLFCCKYQRKTCTPPRRGRRRSRRPPWVGILVCSISTTEKIYPPSPSPTLSRYTFLFVFAMEKVYPTVGYKIHKSICISIRQTCFGGGRYMLFFTHRCRNSFFRSGFLVSPDWDGKPSLCVAGGGGASSPACGSKPK